MNLMDENCIVKMEPRLFIMIFSNTIKHAFYKLKCDNRGQVKYY